MLCTFNALTQNPNGQMSISQALFTQCRAVRCCAVSFLLGSSNHSDVNWVSRTWNHRLANNEYTFMKFRYRNSCCSVFVFFFTLGLGDRKCKLIYKLVSRATRFVKYISATEKKQRNIQIILVAHTCQSINHTHSARIQCSKMKRQQSRAPKKNYDLQVEWSSRYT